MDFQSIVDSVYVPTIIVSVEKREEGGYGEIRIVAGNKKYADLLDKRMKPYGDGKSIAFHPGLIYTEYFHQNINFEDVCYKAAVQKNEVHTYAYIYNVDIWFDIYATPLVPQEGNICYCLYSAIPNENADAMLDTFNTSSTSSDVLKTCIKLHRANNLALLVKCYL